MPSPVAFIGRATKMTDAGLAAAAALIGTTPRLLRTVMQVETAGKAFDSLGRLRMLYEPGQFYRRCEIAHRAGAVAAGVAVASMTGHRYPNDSYPLLVKARALEETTALECCSWGLPQIMGYNHSLAGYDSVQEMIAAFVDSEDAQVHGLATFLFKTGLIPALNEHNWAAVAKGYNGSGYAVNHYDIKLAAAFAALPETATAAPVVTVVVPRVPAVPSPAPVTPPYTPTPPMTFWQRLKFAFTHSDS